MSKRSIEFLNSNVANFGTDVEYQVKLTSAQSEKAWSSIVDDASPSLKVWRIERFQVKEWPTSLYGKFHTGDCYIVLKRNGRTAPFSYNIHFWLGDDSSIDEKGTAAYKAAELDTYLRWAPVEYLEEQYHESPLFKSYFTQLEYLPGGVESGFRHVEPKEYEEWSPRVYNLGSVTVRDCGKNVVIHDDAECNVSDRLAASTLAFSLRCLRPDITIKHLNLIKNDVDVQAT